MNEKSIQGILQKTGAVITKTHVVYTSGRHGNAYVNKDAIYPYTSDISSLCSLFAEHFEEYEIEVVLAPAVGGIILSQWTADHLSKLTACTILSIYAEKEVVAIDDPNGKGRKCFIETGEFVIGRGYGNLIKDKKVLVLEDVATTGGSVKKVVEAARKYGGNVVGVGVLCNRGGITPADIANPPELFSIVNVDLESWTEEECPLCAQGVSINTAVGKGQHFLARKNAR
jgi:orotate phosphoribosyltransferase